MKIYEYMISGVDALFSKNRILAWKFKHVITDRKMNVCNMHDTRYMYQVGDTYYLFYYFHMTENTKCELSTNDMEQRPPGNEG